MTEPGTGSTNTGNPSGNPGCGGRRIVVGLVADPDLPTEIAKKLCHELPDVFSKHVRDDVNWDVRVRSEALPLNDDGNIVVWMHSRERLVEEGWDFMVCLTELTRRFDTQLLITDVNVSRSAALVSLPALGPVRLRHHARNAMVSVMRSLLEGDSPDAAGEEAADAGAASKDGRRPGPDQPHNTRRRDPFRMSKRLRSPASHTNQSHDGGTDSYLPLTGVDGRIRLLLGMVRINRPWRMLPSLSSAIAAAAAMAAFGVFYSSIWNMADALSVRRLTLITLIAITAMVVWLIVYNNLWQRSPSEAKRKEVALYNTATLLTLAVGMSCMYILLFTLTLFGALIVIPGSYLEATLGHPVSLTDYVSVAWLASSLGAVAGAIGSSFENDAAILQATYSRREYERHVRTKRQEESST